MVGEPASIGPEPGRPVGSRTVPLPVIVKLGGSVITRKREVERVRPKILVRLAEEVAENPTVPIILLHGAGSFGHPAAARWGLARPPAAGATSRDRRRGAAIVGAEVRRLHGKVLAALLDAGADPISVPASALAENHEGRLVRFAHAPFARALESGGMPVSFGDVVPDSAWGFSILSADTIALELARTHGASRVVFVSDVPGVLRDPLHGNEIVRELTAETADALQSSERAPDVTGGIAGKVRAMLEIAALGVDAGLISGLSDGALSRAIRGEAVYGSWAKTASRAAETAGTVPNERA
ncbi:MAG: isopentenyl phosphate kinase family protein [Thermoplasmata archaeon]|nr:isopentenyl phosphate kinase family protein [Thermoplasmata archaeon]